ncbi:PREDICTED: uncharacterized protein LOC109352108 [Lupinus angustifolius]|uniref:uncharacterized protein LOC109352108 n=1 Tax=Lupinus angustifolius TaxID=3871 RepID=UPI00092E8A53|nr:PREDICTED: uncharacterized protein LOC109352108 [Lupinus angustifolius]
MSKKPSENLREYVQRWRGLASQVLPRLEEEEQLSIFIDTIQSPYYELLMGNIATNFNALIKVGEKLEGGLRSGKIVEGNTGSGKKPNFLKKKEGETNFVAAEPKKYQTRNTRNNHWGFITLTVGKIPDSPGPWFNRNVTCAYHSGIVGHSIEHCRALKYNVQQLINTKQLVFGENIPDVDQNPLPNHGSQGVNVVEGVQDGLYIWEVHEIKTPMKVIYQEMSRHGMMDRLRVDEDPDSCEMHGPKGHRLEDCSESKLLLQKMLDMRLITIERGPKCQSVNAVTQGEGERSPTWRPSMTRFVPVFNIPCSTSLPSPRWVPVLRFMKPVTEAKPQPFPYNSDKAVTWIYSENTTEKSEQSPYVTNVAGVSRVTRSGRVYGALDIEKNPISTSKGKAKVIVPMEEEAEEDLEELCMPQDKSGVSNEEACEFLNFIKQSEYKVGDQLSRTPTRISILALLMSSEPHRNVLLKFFVGKAFDPCIRSYTLYSTPTGKIHNGWEIAEHYGGGGHADLETLWNTHIEAEEEAFQTSF